MGITYRCLVLQGGYRLGVREQETENIWIYERTYVKGNKRIMRSLIIFTLVIIMI
jgi:hypothetical protein